MDDERPFSEWAPVLDSLHALEILRHYADTAILALQLAPDPVTAAASLDQHLAHMATFLRAALEPGRPLRTALASAEHHLGLAAHATTRGTALGHLGNLIRNNNPGK